jgi:hypothetical protein
MSYAEAMRRGQWKFNGDSIRLSKTNVLLDGQHRLHAVVESGTSQWFIFVDDLDDDSFDTIDQGRKRTGSDVLSIKGEKNSAALASALRWILCIEYGNANHKVTASELLQMLEKYPEARRWATFYSGSKEMRALFNSPLIAIATLFSHKYGDAVVERLMQQLANGEGLNKSDIAYQLRHRAIQNKSRITKIRDSAFAHMTVKAFKAFVMNKPIAVLRVQSDEAFPEI